MSKKHKAKTVYDLKEEIVEEVKAPAAPAAPAKPKSFRSRKEARAYAKANGGKVVEKGRFYVR